MRILPLLALVFLTACSDAQVGADAQMPGADATATSSAAMQASSSSVHPVSLPALMQKQYDGRDLRLGAVQSDNAAYTRYTITYKSGDLTICGIMNIPKGPGPFPVIFLNHGHIDTSVYTNGRGLKREQDFFARNGYAVLHSDYRNHACSDTDEDGEVTLRIGYVEDVINAILAVQKADIPNLDKERVGMLGHSMGGGITINTLVVRPDLVDAAVLYAPVSARVQRNVDRWMRDERPLQTALALYGTEETNPQFWHDISAKNFFDRITTPIQIQHGTADKDVPYEWSVELQQWLTDAGKPADFRTYQGEGHEFGPKWNEFMRSSLEFFDSHLKQ